MTEKTKRLSIHEIKEKLSPSFHIEADGGAGMLSVCISGVIGIGEFSEEEVKIITKRESLKISGKAIRIIVFEQKTVEIVGKIENLTVCLNKGGKGAR